MKKNLILFLLLPFIIFAQGLKDITCKDGKKYMAVVLSSSNNSTLTFKFFNTKKTIDLQKNDIVFQQQSFLSVSDLKNKPVYKIITKDSVKYDYAFLLQSSDNTLTILNDVGLLIIIDKNNILKCYQPSYENGTETEIKNYNSIDVNNIKKSLTIGTPRPSFGLEIPLSYTTSIISVPGALEGLEAGGGGSIDYGLGAFVKINEDVNIRFGFHHYNIIFEPKTTNPEYNSGFTVEEKGSLSATFLYARLMYDPEIFFLGAGFDFCVRDKYSADQYLYYYGKLVGKLENQSKSVLEKSFNSQIDVNIMLGFNIPLSTSGLYKLKPTIMGSLPLVSFWDSGVHTGNYINGNDDEAKIHVFQIAFGLTLEIGF